MSDKIFSRLRRTIRGFVQRHTTEADAEDITDEVMEVIVEKGKHEQLDEEDLKRWSYAVTKNKLGNHFKAQHIEKERLVVLDETIQIASTAPDPYEQLLAKELDAAIQRACARMSAGQRAIIELLRDRATNEEIMAELNLKNPTRAAQKIWKARERLRELLEEEGYQL